MGKHNKEEEQQPDVSAFNDIVAGIESESKVACTKCEGRSQSFREHLKAHMDGTTDCPGLHDLPEDIDLSELDMPARMAELRMRPCGEEEWMLLCHLCAQAIFFTMAADVAQGLAEGLPICGPCGKPIPAMPMMLEHLEYQPLELEAA